MRSDEKRENAKREIKLIKDNLRGMEKLKQKVETPLEKSGIESEIQEAKRTLKYYQSQI